MREAVKAFGLIPVEQARYEADDLIATYARQAQAAGADVLIVSADKDLMQLVGERVAMYDPASANRAGAGARPSGASRAGSRGIFGVGPEQVVDVQGPRRRFHRQRARVPRIGIKTAATLIKDFGDLDTLLARASEIKQEKRRQSLIENADKARISKELVKLVTDVPLEVPLADLVLEQPDGKQLVSFLKAMEIHHHRAPGRRSLWRGSRRDRPRPAPRRVRRGPLFAARARRSPPRPETRRMTPPRPLRGSLSGRPAERARTRRPCRHPRAGSSRRQGGPQAATTCSPASTS